MAGLVAAKCPNCGAGLKIDVDQEIATCGYCHTSAFVKTRARPVTDEIARHHPAIIDVTRSNTPLLLAIMLGVVALGVTAAFVASRPQLRAATPPEPGQDPKERSRAAQESASPYIPAPTAKEKPPNVASEAEAEAEAAPSVPGKPAVRMGANTVSGRLDPIVVQRIIRQNFGRFRKCYEQALIAQPNLAGRSSVRLVIGRDGSVSNVADAGSDLNDPRMLSCVTAAYRGLAFPRPEAGIVTVTSPLLFSR